jgi:hypothetical protein
MAAQVQLAAADSVAAPAPAATVAAPRLNRGGDLYDQWARDMKAENTGFDPTGAIITWLEGFFGGTKLRTPFLRAEDAVFVPPPAARLIVAQQAAPSGGETWTLVTGATSETLARDMARLIAPTVWRKLEGPAAAFDAQTGAVTLAPATQGYFLPMSDWSPANLRLIAAGWFSSNLEYYVLALVLLGALTGLLTAYILRFYGANAR